MASSSSTSSVLAALAGNAVVTTIKLIAALVSGSGAMLSEAIHSFADTANQLLLYLGLKRSTRERDEDFHYGYGGDRFVFGLLSAAGIFFVGCGVTTYHGIHALMHPSPPNVGLLTFGVLGVSFLIEGYVLLVAAKAFNQQRAGAPVMQFLREGADPATVAILLEDGAAVSGVLIASAGILAGHLTGIPQFDAAASILIGLLLGVVALVLVIQNRKLLLGQAVPEGVEDRFIDVLAKWPSVVAVHDVKTRQLTPETYALKAEVELRPAFYADKLSVGAEARLALVSETLLVYSEDVDAMEAAVRAVIPQAKHIDIEIHQPRGTSGAGSRRGEMAAASSTAPVAVTPG